MFITFNKIVLCVYCWKPETLPWVFIDDRLRPMGGMNVSHINCWNLAMFYIDVRPSSGMNVSHSHCRNLAMRFCHPDASDIFGFSWLGRPLCYQWPIYQTVNNQANFWGCRGRDVCGLGPAFFREHRCWMLRVSSRIMLAIFCWFIRAVKISWISRLFDAWLLISILC